jgi:WD40 repeat protein
MDWSQSNSIAIALVGEVIFVNPKTLDTRALRNVPEDIVSLKFKANDDNILLGTDAGDCIIYDTIVCDTITNIQLFDSSVLCSDWRDNTVISGSRRGHMAVIDVREDDEEVRVQTGHLEEICAIRMHPDRPVFATCGNDSSVKIWDMRMIDNPVITYTEHEAAIRAVAWSPTQRDVIVTGGGTNDKTMRMWNTTSGETIKKVDTGSQVCNVIWNAAYNEVLSSHGFSQNHLGLWKGTDLSPIASFHQHKERVLFMAASTDGSTIATAAPGDALHIWKMFAPRSTPLSQSLLMLR